MSTEIQAQDYLVVKNDGSQFVIYGAKLDIDDLAKKMNGHEVMWLNLGGKLILKNVIISIEPVKIVVKEEEGITTPESEPVPIPDEEAQ